jgi:hypothetical protein
MTAPSTSQTKRFSQTFQITKKPFDRSISAWNEKESTTLIKDILFLILSTHSTKIVKSKIVLRIAY